MYETSLPVRLRVLKAASMKVTDFCDVVPCSIVDEHRHARGECFLHQQGNYYRPDDGGST
jgi:hypothetical protein